MKKNKLLALLLVVVLVVGVVISLVPTDVQALAATTVNMYNYAVGSDITNVPLLATTTITMGTVTNGDAFSQGKQYIVNTAQITQANVQSAGTTDDTATATHMIIYAKEGMAIRFQAGTHWIDRPTHGTNGVWFWSWDSTYNYAVIEEGAAGKQATFRLKHENSDNGLYCNVTLVVVEGSKPVLLEEALKTSGLSNYTIRNVPATLYNYDGLAFNKHYDGQSGNYVAFSGVSKGITSTEGLNNRVWTTSGVQANGGGGVALMGILKDTLVNGLPVMSQGQNVDFFSTSAVPGKTVYENVGFQFVYNESTGYYAYNSALNHAQYNPDTNEIELYKQSLAPSDTPNGASHGNAGFYPFEDIDEAFTNTGYNPMDWSTWAQKLEEDAFELIPSEYSTDILQTSATTTASTADMHYGIHMNADFYLPEGKQLNGQDMIYEFTGDDDLWVFIDGKLVLDIGGGHTYVSGSFNLTTGEVWVEKYTQLAAADGGSYSTRVEGTNLKYTDSFLTGLEDDQMHTLQIFYLERHGGVSNCRMHFNLPLAPTNGVMVSKELVNHDGENYFAVTPNTEYTYQIYTASDNDDNIDATTFVPLANAEYSIMGGGTASTDENGYFTLRDGQTAVFEGIGRFTEVYVVEHTPNDGFTYTNSEVSVNGGANVAYTTGQPTEKKVVQLEGLMTFDFTNYMQTYDLSIDKELVNNEGANPNGATEYSFNVKINGANFTGNAEIGNVTESFSSDGNISLTVDEVATIENIPVGMTYSVTENAFPEAPDGYEYEAAQYVNQAGTPTENTTVTVTNTLVALYSDLKITKTGISDLDYHEANDSGNQERQSTIFVITGKSASGLDVYLEVVIHGSNSVTIKDLPIGTYTVTEKTDWSWRYDPTGVTVKNDANATSVTNGITFALTATGEEVTFTNTRTEDQWLSGDNFWENIFNGLTPDPAPNPTPTE